FHEEIGPAFDQLNKRTHLKPDTVITDATELENLANETIGALLEIFDVTEEVRTEIITRIEGHLYDEAIGAFINENDRQPRFDRGRLGDGGCFVRRDACFEHRWRYNSLRDHWQR